MTISEAKRKKSGVGIRILVRIRDAESRKMVLYSRPFKRVFCLKRMTDISEGYDGLCAHARGFMF